MLIAQISDPHIVKENHLAYGKVKTDEMLENAISAINQFEPKINLALVTGDLTDKGTKEENIYAKKLLDELACPYFVIPGNHDCREHMVEVFAPDHCRVSDQAYISYTFNFSDFCFIGLDSSIPGESGGELCLHRLIWLEQQLQNNKDKPVVIFLHHPPCKCGVLETDEDGFIGREKFEEIVARYLNIQRILCGHIHLATNSLFGNTIFNTAPSTGMQLHLDLTMSKPSAFEIGSPGYLLHHWTSDNKFNTHVRYVGEIDGPYLF